jgi:hypothetical protein
LGSEAKEKFRYLMPEHTALYPVCVLSSELTSKLPADLLMELEWQGEKVKETEALYIHTYK